MRTSTLRIGLLLLLATANSAYADATMSVAPKTIATKPNIVVYKNESCGCCKLWVDHLRDNGFAVRVENVANMSPIKERVGVPVGKGSCHTAEVNGYFIEGHVPAADIHRLLKMKPKAKGLTVPGMPLGSPGMEQGGQRQPYEVLLVEPTGNTSVFARHGNKPQ